MSRPAPYACEQTDLRDDGAAPKAQTMQPRKAAV